MKSPAFRSAMACGLSLMAITAPTQILAQQADGATAPADRAEAAVDAEQVHDDLHDRRVDYRGNIVVTATGLTQLDVLAGTSVFEAAEIQQNLAGQIGDVLVKLPGVSATSFSPGASRPVLRGFSGERVRVLTDGLGTIDVSNTSADHATTIDPLTAERIEVLRGPAVMLYGSQAIGGAVNVIAKRIPRRVPDEPVHIDGMATWDSAYDLREGGVSIDTPLTDRLVAHIDGSWRKTNDLEIAGYALAPGLRADLLAEAAEEADEGHLDEAAELREAADQRGTLPDSATRTWTANAGLAFIDGDNTLGVALGWYDTAYGVPTRPGMGHAHGGDEEAGEQEEAEGSVSIGLQQFRADMRGALALGDGAFERLHLRAGYSDYTHTEFEGDEVGTVFDAKGLEARVELSQKNLGWWRGSIGGQFYHRDFSAQGAEAYVPPNLTDQLALFTLQEFGQGPLQLEAAARLESTDVAARSLGLARQFNNYSGALGLIYETKGSLRGGINLSRASRAPSAEELFSSGPHIATQSFEMGDPDLSSETAWGAEAFLRGMIGTARVGLSVYKSWFSNYVYQGETGAEEDGLPVFQYLQGDADYFGVEGELNYPFYSGGGVTLSVDLRGDYIRATLDDGTPVPRIPPLSLLGALEAETGPFDARAELQWFAKQDRVAPYETPTDAFTLVNLSLAWHPMHGDKTVTVLLAADNLFDVTGRRHASFTKDFVPLAGRNIKVSLRFSL